MSLRRTACAAATALALAFPASAQDNVLRVVPHADLRTLDPVAVSVVITRMHGLMIYETLFAWDENLQPKPQMVELVGLARRPHLGVHAPRRAEIP